MTDLLAHFSAPAATAAKVGVTKQTPAVKAATKSASTLSKTALATIHDRATRKGEAWIVFGMSADKVSPIGVRLDAVSRVRGDGTLMGDGIAAVTPATGGRFKRDGVTVSYGRTIPAPTAGKVQATRAEWCALIGVIVDSPVMFPMSQVGDTATWRTGETAHTALKNGMVQSVSVSVRLPKSGDAWSVSVARVYSGGKLPDTDPETVALAALDLGETGEAAVIEAAAILTGATPAKATRSAGNRAKVANAKRAAVK